VVHSIAIYVKAHAFGGLSRLDILLARIDDSRRQCLSFLICRMLSTPLRPKISLTIKEERCKVHSSYYCGQSYLSTLSGVGVVCNSLTSSKKKISCEATVLLGVYLKVQSRWFLVYDRKRVQPAYYREIDGECGVRDESVGKLKNSKLELVGADRLLVTHTIMVNS